MIDEWNVEAVTSLITLRYPSQQSYAKESGRFNSKPLLVGYACRQTAGSYHFDSGLTSPCYLVKFEEAGGRACLLRWKDGVGKFGWNDLPESSVLLFALMGPGINTPRTEGLCMTLMIWY